MHVDLYLFYTDNKNPDERNSLNSIVFNLTARILFIRFLLLIFLIRSVGPIWYTSCLSPHKKETIM